MNETMTDSNFLLDTCVWIGYFSGDTPSSKEIIESSNNTLFTSVLSIYEFIKKMKDKKIPKIIIDNMIDIIEESSVTLCVDGLVSKKAATNCIKFDLHAMDGLIYSTAEKKNIILITTDKHFSKTPKTIII